MFPLTAKLSAFRRAASFGPQSENMRVLPRLLRRPARFFSRMMQGDVHVPKHAEAVLGTSVIGAAILYGSVMGGQFETAVNAASAKVGLSVNEIEISGNTYTTANAVFSALNLEDNRSIVSIDPADARDALRNLPWVQEARIAKVYPNKLKIDVSERDAFAVWQQGEALTVIEQDGSVIGGYAADAKLAALPLLVGKGAAEQGADFIAQVARFQDVSNRVRAYIRVGTRRWDLRLDNGLTVRLPVDEVDDALRRLTQMHYELEVLDRDLAAIDLRLKDRTIFALTENARMERDDFVDARTKAAREQRKLRGSRI